MQRLTLNNLSCAYKKDDQVTEAQTCLEKALEFSMNNDLHSYKSDLVGDKSNQSLYELNLCVICS